MGSSNKGQGGTSYQSSQVQIPAEVMARYNAVNARAETAANTPWEAYGGEFVAPVNQTQQGGIDAISNAAGSDKPYFDQATSVLNQSLSPANALYGTAAGQVGSGLASGTALTQQGVDTAHGAMGAASPYNSAATGQLNSAYANTQPVNNAALGLAAGATGQVNAGNLDIGRYMSPYNEAVVQSTLGNLRQDQSMAQADLRDSQILSGSFGGDRSGVASANLRRQQDMAYGQVASQLYNANYGQALGAAQQQQGVNLGADQANRAALATGAQNIAGIGQQMYGQGAATAQGNLGIGQQIYGQGQGLAAAQMQGGNQLYSQGVGAAGANAGLAAGQYGMASNAANTYGQLGTQQLSNQLTQGQAQIGAGTVQQQTQQAQDTALYNQFMQEKGYPFQVAQFLANIAMGTGAQSGSTTNTVNTTAQPFFSDERLKENIHVIGHTNDGQPIIRFNYKGDKSTQIGLSAQETEKKHPDAVGLASGFKTVDYDAATRDSIAKAGGGGLAAGNDNFAQLLEQQRAMFPGGNSNARGIPTGEGGLGPHGIPIAPLRAQAPKAANHSMPQQSQQPSGLKQTTDSALGMVNTAKGLASGYSEGKDALFGTAGKDGKAGSGGLIGTGGKYDWQAGWLGKQLGNDNPTPTGPITTTQLPPPPPSLVPQLVSGQSALAAPPDPSTMVPRNPDHLVALQGPTVERMPGRPETGLASAHESLDLAAPSVADAGLATGAADVTSDIGSMFAYRGGRMQRAAGGGMPYSIEGYVPEDLYKPIDPEKPESAKPSAPGAGGAGGGKKDETGKAVGSLVGMGLGSMFGMPGVGAMVGGMAGGMFNDGGRVGLAAGGGVMDEDEASRIALEGGNVLPFERPSTQPAQPRPLPERSLPTVAFDNSPESWKTDRLLKSGDAYFDSGRGEVKIRKVPRFALQDQNLFPESGTPTSTGLAAGQNAPAGMPSVPALPDGTPIIDTPPAASAAPAGGLATPPAGGPPSPAAVAAVRSAVAPAPTGTSGGPGRQSETYYDPKNPTGYTRFVHSGESDGKNFNNPNWPTAQGGPDGPGQFIPGTWQGFVQARPDIFAGKSPAEILEMRKNPELAAMATDWYANKNSGPLQAAGVPLTYGNLAMAHMLDGPVAATFLSNPDMNAFAALKKAGLSDEQARQTLLKNGGDLNMTAGQFAQFHKDRMDGVRPAARQQVSALNAGPAPGGDGNRTGLGTDPSAAAAPQEIPDFIDRAGNWIDKYQKPIMTGLAFIGNMLGSKSHQLTGAIGDGLAAAAPMYLSTSFKQTDQAQNQERIDITARSQYMSVLARQQQMQNDYMYANNGKRSPELDAQMAKTIALINGKGGVAAVPGGAPDSLRGAPPAPGGTVTQQIPAKTDLAPVTSSPLAPPAGAVPPTGTQTPATTSPEPGVYTGGPPPMTDDFLNKLDPNRNPKLLRERANQLRANGDRDGSQRLEDQARAEEQIIKDTGQGTGPGQTQVRLPGWDTYQAVQKNIAVNQDWLQKAEAATQARLTARQNVNQIKALIENFESGTGTDIKAQIAGVADALGIARPKTDTMDQAAFKAFLKDAYNQILNSGAGGGSTDQMRTEIAGAFASPTLPPEANKKILAQFLGELNYADAYAEHLAKSIKGNQLVDQKIVGDQWRSADREKNNPEYYRAEAYKDIAVLGATPENTRDIKDGHSYMLKPEDYYRLQGLNPQFTPQQIQQWYKDQGRRAVKFKATRDEQGGIKWQMVK